MKSVDGLSFVAWLLFLSFFVVGCGETFRGAWRDTQRISEGTKKIFIAEG